MFKHIVVGVDGSESSDRALAIACDLAGKYGSDLCLVHVPQPDTVAFALGAVAGYHMVTTMPSDTEVSEAAEKLMARARDAATAAGCKVGSERIIRGEPADEIVAVARDVGADLIVSGRRGLGSVGALLQGSTTQRIGKLAECAVLSVA